MCFSFSRTSRSLLLLDKATWSSTNGSLGFEELRSSVLLKMIMYSLPWNRPLPIETPECLLNWSITDLSANAEFVTPFSAGHRLDSILMEMTLCAHARRRLMTFKQCDRSYSSILVKPINGRESETTSYSNIQLLLLLSLISV